ncbi:MAG: DUF1553 domain-containing protein [Blastocatellia bacterium]
MNGKTDTASTERQAALKHKLEELQDQLPPPLPVLHSVADVSEKKSPIHLLARGEYNRKGERAACVRSACCWKTALPELPDNTAKPRAELAKWIVDPNNPLTARVLVNWIWQYHFGRGIVATRE